MSIVLGAFSEPRKWLSPASSYRPCRDISKAKEVSAQGEEVEEGGGKEGLFLASRKKKMHFRNEFKTKF